MIKFLEEPNCEIAAVPAHFVRPMRFRDLDSLPRQLRARGHMRCEKRSLRAQIYLMCASARVTFEKFTRKSEPFSLEVTAHRGSSVRRYDLHIDPSLLGVPDRFCVVSFLPERGMDRGDTLIFLDPRTEEYHSFDAGFLADNLLSYDEFIHDKDVLYVGKTTDLGRRMYAHHKDRQVTEKCLRRGLDSCLQLVYFPQRPEYHSTVLHESGGLHVNIDLGITPDRMIHLAERAIIRGLNPELNGAGREPFISSEISMFPPGFTEIHFAFQVVDKTHLRTETVSAAQLFRFRCSKIDSDVTLQRGDLLEAGYLSADHILPSKQSDLEDEVRGTWTLG